MAKQDPAIQAAWHKIVDAARANHVKKKQIPRGVITASTGGESKKFRSSYRGGRPTTPGH